MVSCTDDTITVTIRQKELSKELPGRLEAAHIWFKQPSSQQFVFKKVDANMVVKLSRKIHQEIIPPGRSSQFGPEIKVIKLHKLDEKHVPYEFRKFGEQEWLVWPEQYHTLVTELHAEAEQELTAKLRKIIEQNNRMMLQRLRDRRASASNHE
jgi:hypothetical protein